MRTSAHETRAEDGVGCARNNRSKQNGIITGIVFEVGVLDNNHFAARRRKTRAQGRAFPAVAGLINDMIDDRRDFSF